MNNNLNKVKYEEPCDGRLSSTVPREGRGETPRHLLNWIHNLLKGVSLTGALFVFQACYGTPEAPLRDERGEAPMTFSVVSRATGEPLEGVVIKGSAWSRTSVEPLGTTDAEGRCRLSLPYIRNAEGPFLVFEDEQGRFFPKDTVLADLQDREIVIRMEALQ